MEKNYKLIDGRQFHFHEKHELDEEGYYYDVYDERGKNIDGGFLEYDFEKELSEAEVLEQLAEFSDIAELLDISRTEIEEIIEKPTYHIVAWEKNSKVTVQPMIIETEIENVATAIDLAKELWRNNKFEFVKVETELGYEQSKAIYICSNAGERYFDLTRHEIESQREDMIKSFKLYYTISSEIKARLGELYIVHEIEERFENNPELYDRFSQSDKEKIFELSHQAWIDVSYNVGSGTIANTLLDVVIDNKITMEELAELSSSDVLDIVNCEYDFEDELEWGE